MAASAILETTVLDAPRPVLVRPALRRPPGRTRLVVAVDVLSFVLAIVVGLAVDSIIFGRAGYFTSLREVGIVFVPASLAMFTFYGLYSRTKRRILISAHDDVRDIFYALITSAMITSTIFELAGSISVPATGLLATVLIALSIVPFARTSFNALFPPATPARILIVGSGAIARRIAKRLTSERRASVEVMGFVDDHPLDPDEVLGSMADLPHLCREFEVSRIVVAFSQTPQHEMAEYLRDLSPGIAISVVPRLYELVCWRSQVDEFGGMPMMDIAPPQLSLPARTGKRIFDILGSVLGLVVLSPVMVAIGVAVKLTSPGPVFFLQRRSGREGRVFRIIKFRTMHVDAEMQRDQLLLLNEMDGPLFKIHDDPRITPLGRFLRRTSLDEIPQLVNVLLGQMSFVGPRPFVVEESERIDGWATRRLEVRPGITGIWQVSGRNELSYDELRALDYAYVASWSYWWDIRILMQTPMVVLQRRGAH